MTWETVFPELVKVILGGGFAATVSTILLGRRQARRIEGQEERAQKKLPVEVDSMIVQGAEHTVTIMQAANDRLVAEVGRLVEENERLRDQLVAQHSEISALRAEAAQLGGQLAEANQTAHEALVRFSQVNKAYTDLRARLTTLEHDTAPPTGE